MRRQGILGTHGLEAERERQHPEPPRVTAQLGIIPEAQGSREIRNLLPRPGYQW